MMLAVMNAIYAIAYIEVEVLGVLVLSTTAVLVLSTT